MDIRFEDGEWRAIVDGKRVAPGEIVDGRPIEAWVSKTGAASDDPETIRAAAGFLGRTDGWRRLGSAVLSSAQKGKPKHFTPEQLAAATKRLDLANAARKRKRAERLAGNRGCP